MLNILEAVLRGLSSGVRDSEITVRMILVSSAMQGPAIFSVLSPGQTIATLLGATCWLRLATLLRRVETCWVLLAQIWKWSNFSCNICASCARACALVRFSISNMSQHVATGWPNEWNMLRPTMLITRRLCDKYARGEPITIKNFVTDTKNRIIVGLSRIDKELSFQ